MIRSTNRERAAWIYKCSVLNPDPDRQYSWVDPDNGGWLAHVRNDAKGIGWGGENWIRSGKSWANLAMARRGDLIFCQQTDLNGFVGLTVAASDGYPDSDGDHPDKCSTIDIGPRRVCFEYVVDVPSIKQELGANTLQAFASGHSQHTFHRVEPEAIKRLLTLCIRFNPHQQREITRIANIRLPTRTIIAASPPEDGIITDPIRREMLIEAFVRNARWAALARQLYGRRCMVPRCSFRLLTEDGTLYIEVHHIIAMCHGGSPNDPRNLSVLCPNHHRAAHFGKLIDRRRIERLIRREQARRLKRRG